MITKDEAIKRSIEKHGDKYGYEKVDFKKVTDPVTIICPIHGEFTQTMRQHYRGQGCPHCGVEKRANKKRDDTASFIEKAVKVWGNTYDYSKVVYTGTKDKVTLVCPIHGDFLVIPGDHLNLHRGCPKCGNARKGAFRKKTTKDFIEKAIKVHGTEYTYEKTEYVNGNTDITITCQKHGDFTTNPYHYLHGGICPQCAHEQQSTRQTLTLPEFIFRARAVHGDKYDYSKVNYVDGKTPVTIICPIHGEFQQKPYYHLAGNGCQSCGVRESKAQNEIYEFCCNLLGSENVIQNCRKEIYPYEIDIYIPSLKVGIEYNGILWHSDRFTEDQNYHLKKLNKCNQKGIKLIQVFEDEYKNHRDIVLSKIKHLLGHETMKNKIYGRKCKIQYIVKGTADKFLNENHIQGGARASVYLGAYCEDKLVAVMLFKQENMRGNWELVRFASLKDTVCCGVAGKLFKYFVRIYEPLEIKSFADRRWTIDVNKNVYTNLGFTFDGFLKPDYRYFKRSDGIVRQHKFGFRKQILHKKYGLPLTMTENEMTKKLGYHKIYDCGLIKYVWRP